MSARAASLIQYLLLLLQMKAHKAVNFRWNVIFERFFLIDRGEQVFIVSVQFSFLTRITYSNKMFTLQRQMLWFDLCMHYKIMFIDFGHVIDLDRIAIC